MKPTSAPYAPGQRCISDTEIELGLGMVLELDGRRLTIAFAAVDETRVYVIDSAPLTRMRFLPGDEIQSVEGWSMTVVSVSESGPLLSYHGPDEHGETVELPEQLLSPSVRLNQARGRLLAGQFEHPRWYNARCEALQQRDRLRASEHFGLAGARAQLLPHQLHVALTVSDREVPRVLLADEVGLGKTIEAGLILHRMLLQERVKRVLLVVPASLQHQWLVEMKRRFNIPFSLVDLDSFEDEDPIDFDAVPGGDAMDRLAAALLTADSPSNPFEDRQLVLCAMDTLLEAGNDERALAAGWDMLIVDEAHHLGWNEQTGPDDAYQAVEALAATTPSVLLLTATPESLGDAGHFARLRLLDPDRFADLAQYREEQGRYRDVASAAEPLLDSERPLEASDLDALGPWLEDDQRERLLGGDEAARRAVLGEIVDRHGTGRVLLRNTRAAIGEFAERQMHAVDLDGAAGEGDDWWRDDPRVSWLIDTLKSAHPRRFLLICSTRDMASTLAEALRVRAGVIAAVFHEGMSLIDRDRAAAHFADDDEGAPVLIASEIGSEGRNFQFVSDLILFDLPALPGLLEQRIGRLDRIGQRGPVRLHVPTLRGSPQARLRQWYHEGMNAFEQTCTIGEHVLSELGPARDALIDADPVDEHAWAALIERTRALSESLRAQVERGRDRLLEMTASDPAALELVERIEDAEAQSPWPLIEQVADCFGLEIEPLSARRHRITIGQRSEMESFPGLGSDGELSVTDDRDAALAREDVAFLSWEHPMVIGALDLMVDGDRGKVAIAALQSKPFTAGEVLIETWFRLHAPLPPALGHLRFLGQSAHRALHMRAGHEIATKVPMSWLAQRTTPVKREVARRLISDQREVLLERLQTIESSMAERLPAMRDEALTAMRDELGAATQRLEALAGRGVRIREDELRRIAQRRDALEEGLSSLRLSMDAVRVVFCY